MKVALGIFSNLSTCLSDVSDSRLLCMSRLNPEAKAILQAWFCIPQALLEGAYSGQPPKTVPQLSHKWTCAFSMTVSKILLSHEQCVRISGLLKVERSAHDLCESAAGCVCGLSHRGIDTKICYVAPTESVVILQVEI